MNSKEIKQEGMTNLAVELDGRQEDFRVMVLEKSDKVLLLSPVLVNDKVIGFGKECNIKFLYIDDGKVYMWEVPELFVVKSPVHGTCYKIELSGEGKELNRREAYRVYIGGYMDIIYLREKGPVKMSVLVRDISETGFCFTTKMEYEKGRIIKLKIPTEQEIIVLSSQIIRKQEMEGAIGFFQYGCRFKERDEKLAFYLAKLQREKRKQQVNGK